MFFKLFLNDSFDKVFKKSYKNVCKLNNCIYLCKEE